ncbi:succinate dehydrogenase, cytochrome b556 subunit [Albimonas sp. CAU 1670]|uniref:succinate dehydrogenase, cytochrome b556 subunit n=1 Tax=Albimonas sp. CAU 1670 TaxID=3032599 RepID=UPI0023D9B2BA|nr:succinate dehydrogenase, cytochrome b556 subunit [Albimonas sp. CAU 1670]MDF2233256.1 succinate dehydrogenase, cytochrome b556 subunit [Albimonas sp. CAU 1670]
MADVNRGNRPLSPFMIGPYYRPQWTSMLSIVHRITGCALAVGAVLIVWWLLAAASGPDYFATADWIVTSWLGQLVLFGCLWALLYHFCNGIRHLIWDVGLLFDVEKAELAGKMTVVVSVLLTLIVWII